MNMIRRALKFATLVSLALAAALYAPARNNRTWGEAPAGSGRTSAATRLVHSAATSNSPSVSGVMTVSAPSTAPGALVSYRIVITNSGQFTQADNPGPEFTDVLPQSLTLLDEQATSGTIADDGDHTVTWNGSLPASGSVTITIRAYVAYGVPLNTTISNQGTVFYDSDNNGTNDANALTDDPNLGGTSDPTTFKVLSPAQVSGTMTLEGSPSPGSTITYLVILSNKGVGDQLDNPGPEFTDVLPAGVTLVSADASSGLATANTATNTVTWNGSIAADDSATLTITATVNNGTGGQTISNQGTVNYDADGNGTNEATAATNISSFVVCPSSLIVTTSADSGAGSLRQAVADACPGATITFDTRQMIGPITLTSGEIALNKNLMIQGPTTQGVTVSGNNNSRIFNLSSNNTVSISDLTISGGRASAGGAVLNAGDLTINNSTLSGNTAVGGKGGAIDSEDGSLRLFNSTVSGNTAETFGGGIVNGGSSVAIFTNVTISNNRANTGGNGTGEGGGLAQTSSSDLTLNNTLVAGNFKGVGAGATPSDIFVDTASGCFLDSGSSNNLIGVDTGLSGDITSGTSGNQIGTSAAPVNPQLGALANNGGPTRTHALLSGSPAIDAGSNELAVDQNGQTSTDQRGTGFPRIFNGTVDIGAVEVQIQRPAHLSGTKTVSGTFNVGGTVTYTVVLSNSGPATQLDNPGNEFTDVLPAGLTLVSASANSGTAVATVGTNTVTWNGSIPSGNSVTITIQATIKSGQERQTITNQGSIAYDADGNGTNESSALTNQSSFKVNNPPTISAVGVTRTAGSPSANSTIANVNDAEDAKNTLAVTVNNGSSATVTGVTVSNLSVNTSGVVSADVVAACGATTANFTLKVTDSGGLSNTATLTVTVNANTAPTLTYNTPQTVDFGGSLTVTPATGPSDNGSISSIVVQSKGTYTGTISVNNSTGVVSLSNAAPAGTHTITIRATDNCGTTTDATFNLVVKSQPTLSINDVTLNEGNSGTTNFNFTVTLSAASSLTVTVNYQTANGTATLANNDYQAANGRLTFNPGETTKPITVLVNGDTFTEPDETFTVNLSAATNAVIARAQGTGTILNDDLSAIQLSAASYTVYEGDGRATITVNRVGGIDQPASVDYATADQSGLNPCSQTTGLASQRCDYVVTMGTLKFAAGESSKQVLIPIVDDAYVEGPETFTIALSHPAGGVVQGISSATVTIIDNDVAGEPSPLNQDSFFVRQQYLDFLGREADALGATWESILRNCPASGVDANGNHCDRIEVSADFFRSEEFQQRGYFIYRFSKLLPSVTDPNHPEFGHIPLYSEFLPDFARVSGPLTANQLEANKVAFVADFMNRTEFQNRYGSLTDNAAFLDAILQTLGLPNHPNRNTWVAELNNGQTRAQVLREMIEDPQVYQRFYNEAFVIMQYFGYLRRTADASYVNWIQTLNVTGDYRTMINGFLNSAEYRLRFAP